MAATTKTWLNNNAPSCEDDDLNGFKDENNNLILGSSQALNVGDRQQSHKSVAHYSSVGQFFTGGGIADAYTAAIIAPRIAPPSLTNGMELNLIIPATSTGASTLNAFGSGAVAVKLEGGVSDPVAGDMESGKLARFKYFISPSAHWEILNPIVSDAIGGSTGDVGVQTFIVSGTYTPTAGAKAIKVTSIGGGGGGGGATQSATLTGGGGGGGGGGASVLSITIDPATYTSTITIGAGGVGGVGIGGPFGGAIGGTTTYDDGTNTLTSLGGGGGGSNNTGGTRSPTGGDAGIGSGGDINLRADGGGFGLIVGELINASDASGGGNGGGSLFNGGGQGDSGGTNDSAPGEVGLKGGGGSGAHASSDTTDQDGGDGGNGIVIVEEFF